MSKKSILLLVSLLALSIAFVLGSQILNKNNESASIIHATNLKSKPTGWPWRGISMQSGKSDYKDIQFLHNSGINFVRLQLKPSKRTDNGRLAPIDAFYNELLWTDKILDECKKYNMTAMIAYNFFVLDPKDAIDDKSEEFWQGSKYLDSAYSQIDIICKRFKNRGAELSAYEFMSEPAIGGDEFSRASSPPRLEEFFKNALKTLRKYDNVRYFLLTPGPYGKPLNYVGFKGFNIKDDKLIYGAHQYLPQQYTHQGIKNRPRGIKYPGVVAGKQWDKNALIKSFNALKSFETKTGYPIFIGEFQSVRWAPNGNQWVKDVIEIMNERKWGWAYFAYKPDNDFWNPYMEVKNPTDQPDDWKLEDKGNESAIWKYLTTTALKKK
jgi:hypothetical protein